ncbi:recombinase family protein [Terribacillus halophilus]|uniref:recombinase family protein n=1 Tax=Terribacillus halophilus TaxID=361279 RepID=UPI0009861B20|nr:recombinase family protein [Terribacillus halophilus]
MKRVAIYVRKSRKDENSSEDKSLELQIDTLIRIAEKHNYSYTIYKEIGSSVDSNRTEYQKLKDNIQLGIYDNSYILAKHTDRLSRDLLEALTFKNLLEKHHIKLHTPDGIFDFSLDDVDFANNIQLMLNQQEYKKTRRKLLKGKVEAAKSGNYMSSVIAFGYKRDPYTKQLLIDESKAPIVRSIFKLAVGGIPINEITRIINQKGYRNQYNRPFSSTAMKYIVKNQIYIGRIVYCSTSLGEEVIKDEAHEALVSQEDFYKVQELIKTRITGYGRRSKLGLKSPLNSLIVCGKCHYPLILDKDYQYKEPTYYTKKCHKCGGTVGQKVSIVEKAVFNALDEYNDQILNEINSLDSFTIDDVKEKLTYDLAHLQKQLRKVKVKDDNLLDLYLNGEIEKSRYRSRKDDLDEEAASLNQSIADIKTEIEQQSVESKKEQMLKLYNQSKMISSLSLHEQNHLFSLLIERVLLTKTEKYSVPEITIVWREL